VVSCPVAPGGTASPRPGTRTVRQDGVDTLTGRAEPDEWLACWLDAGAAANAAVTAVLDETTLCGPSVARDVAARVRRGGLLIAGSSNPVRDLDLAMRPYEHALGDLPLSSTGQVRVLANRGLSGIDGTVSTAIGAALAWQAEDRASRPAYALLGDLTFLHDCNGLLLAPGEHSPDLVLVVLNDDGGGIFHALEPGEAAHAASFERLFGTPHGVDLGALCAATGTPYERVDTRAALAAALDRAEGGPAGIRVIEARVDRAGRRDLEARLARAVQVAVTALA